MNNSELINRIAGALIKGDMYERVSDILCLIHWKWLLLNVHLVWLVCEDYGAVLLLYILLSNSSFVEL